MPSDWSRKSQLKQLYHRIDKKIIGVLTHNRPVRSNSKEFVVSVDIRGSTYDSLLMSARKYDAYRFFVAKTEAKQLRDQNTGGMVLRAYIHTRDYGIGLVKRVYNLRYKI